MRRTLFVLLRLGIGIGLLVYLVESKVVDPRVFARLISSWPISVLAIALLLVDLVLMAWRLCCLFRARGMPLAFVSSFAADRPELLLRQLSARKSWRRCGQSLLCLAGE